MDQPTASTPAVARTVTVTLTAEQAAFVDRVVARGVCTSAEELVKVGLRALQDDDEETERWLREEVVPVAIAVEQDPSQLIPADEVFADLYALIGREAAAGDRPGEP